MLTHNQIWRAIDALAARNDLSPSGLAKLAGLDPTTFNKSKRGGANGKLRWPSTESVSKVLAATGASLDDFVALVAEAARARLRAMVPLIGMAQAGQPRLFRRCRISRRQRAGKRSPFPNSPTSMPMRWRSPAIPCCRSIATATASWCRRRPRLRRGDRVVVKTHAGEVMAKQLAPHDRPAHRTQIASIPPYEDRDFRAERVVFVHRIIWASQ